MGEVVAHRLQAARVRLLDLYARTAAGARADRARRRADRIASLVPVAARLVRAVEGVVDVVFELDGPDAPAQ